MTKKKEVVDEVVESIESEVEFEPEFEPDDDEIIPEEDVEAVEEEVDIEPEPEPVPTLSPKEQLIADVRANKAHSDQYEDLYKEPFPW